jgi:hypothetical protein
MWAMEEKGPMARYSSVSALWKRTGCSLLDGAERCLPAQLRSSEEIFVITMQMPALRDVVRISFYGENRQVTHEVDAVVTGLSYHPSELRLCGFAAAVIRPEALFPYPPPLENLMWVKVTAAALPLGETALKRRDPRVRTRVPAAVHLLGKNLSVKILNLSMSGALIGFDKDQIPPDMSVGALFRIDAYDAHRDISLCVKAEVIRLIGVGRPTSAGVRFIDMDDEAKSCVEGMILNEIFCQDLLSNENTLSESTREILTYD